MPRRHPIRIARCGASALALAIACGWAAPLSAGPKGGVVAHGGAEIRTSGQVTAIQQSSDRIIINWESFDVDANETVRFEQPGRSSIALNRVAAGTGSRIDGAIEANGNVWLVNPSGVMFGGGARVDVGGLIVSTVGITDDNFTSGNMVFDQAGDPGAKIVNQGSITFEEAGLAGFVAPHVVNRGRIAGRLGRITIAGRDSFSVDISGDGLFELDLADAAPAAHARLINEGELSAAGGVVVIDAATARDAVDATISAGGVISAASADTDGGTIVLSGERVEASGKIDASSGAGVGGTIAMTGDLVHVQSGALVDASGALGGGIVRIGALAPGMAPLPARRTLVSAGAQVRADANLSGDGGDVLVWGEQAAAMRGALSARGIAHGGFIEISSPQDLLFDGTADASGGLFDGLVLLDPALLIIGFDGSDDGALSDDQILADEGGLGTFSIAAATLNGMSGTVLLQASDTIRIEQEVRFGGNLTLEAGRDILLFADIQADGALTMTANASVTGAPAITDGAIFIDAGRTIEAGGALTLTTGADGRLDGSAMAAADSLQMVSGGDLTASAMTLAGDLSVESFGAADLRKDMQLAGDVDLKTHGGALVFASFGGEVGGVLDIDTGAGGETPGNVTVQFGGALDLAGLNAGNASIVGKDGIAASGAVTLTGFGTFQTNGADIVLTNAANSFAGEVRVLTGADAGSGAWNIDLRTAGDLMIAQLNGDTARVRAGGAIAQTGDVMLEGASRFEAVGDIGLARSSNTFGGALSLSGAAADIATDDALTLGASDLASLTLDAGGDVAQSGALDILGATTITTTGDAVVLRDGANSFSGGISVLTDGGGASAADVALAAGEALSLGLITAAAVQVDADGAITQSDVLTASGDVSLTSNGALTLNKDNMFSGDLNLSSQAGAITVASFSTNIDGTMSLDARKGAAVGAVLVQVNSAITLGAMDAGQVQVFAADGIDAPGALSIAGAATFQTRETDISLTNGANSFGGELRMLSSPGAAEPGDVSVAAAGDLTISQLSARGADVTAGGDIAQSGAITTLAASSFAATGNLDLSRSDNSLTGATDLSGLEVQVTTSGDLTLGETTAQTLEVVAPGTLDQQGAVTVAGLLSLDVGQSAMLGRADNQFASVSGDVSGAVALLRDADGFEVAGLDANQLIIGADGDRQFGDITIGGIFGAGSSVYTLGDVTVAPDLGASFGDDATLNAGADLSVADTLLIGEGAGLHAGDDVAINFLSGGSATLSGHDVTVGTVALSGALSVAARNDLRLGDATLAASSSASTAQLAAGGGAQISAFDSGDAILVDAGAGIDLSAATAVGDVILSTISGDVRLASIAAGGDFGTHAGDGAIRARGLTGQIAPALSVAGATRLDASGAVRLPASDGSTGHVFGGPISVTRASDVVIEAAGDLIFGATDIAFSTLDAETTAGIFDRTGNRISGGIHLISSGSITGLGAAYLRANSDLRFDAPGAVDLTGANDIGGAVSVSAGALQWAELGDMLLADIDVAGADISAAAAVSAKGLGAAEFGAAPLAVQTGDVALIAGVDGGFGDASIRQGGVATVPVSAMINGVAQTGTQVFSGAVVVGGDLDLSSGLAAEVALADLGAEVDRDVDLTDPDNIFNGAVALRRIAGSAALTEEAGAETIGQDDIDGGELHLRQVEVFGDIAVSTSDDVIFDGRMTALIDEDIPETRPSIPVGPDEDDPARQGLADLAADDFRLWLSDGATLTVDATAGGADGSGGLIRFDRPVDGFNDLRPERTLDSVLERSGAGGMRLTAGGRDIRFRDYVGAGAPVGDVTITSANDVAIGHTYAARSPDKTSPATRYLLGGSPENDVFFASNLTIDATGDITLFAPPGLRDKFETADSFFGVNLRGFTFGLSLRPTRVEAFGFIGGSSRKAAGLFPVGPRAPQYNLNGCVIGDVADCTGVSAPNVLTVLRLDRAQILNVEREDLFELFVSYGNEELWGVPPGYVLDLNNLGSEEEIEEDQDDEAQVSSLQGAEG